MVKFMISKYCFIVKFFNKYFANNDPMNGIETNKIEGNYATCYYPILNIR